MNILIDYSYREEDMQKLPIEELALFVLEAEELGDDCEASISFIDNDEMTELNQTYRGKTGPTDVLSFECDGCEDDEMDFPDFPDEEPVFELGDVIIAPDVAEAQAKEYGTTFEQEIELLLVHGLLHLCGYDHIEDEDAAEMQERERDILGKWFAAQGADEALTAEPIAYEARVAAKVVEGSALSAAAVESLQ